MKGFLAVSGSVIAIQSVTAAVVPRFFEISPTTRLELSMIQIERELGEQLSPSTTMYGPGDGGYADCTRRWNHFAMPKVQLVVQPGEEADVSAIVSCHHLVLILKSD